MMVKVMIKTQIKDIDYDDMTSIEKAVIDRIEKVFVNNDIKIRDFKVALRFLNNKWNSIR